MCVILTAETRRLSDRLIEQAVETNPDGNGIAWIERGAVRFEKGITLDEAQAFASYVPLPYVFHARIATVGGARPELCHPFPLDRRLNPNQYAGRSRRGVLFHNGHWSGWQEWVTTTEEGYWSDSRAMAELVSQFGAEALGEAVPNSQRVVLLTTAGVKRYGMGWTEPRPGVMASNTCFLRSEFILR